MKTEKNSSERTLVWAKWIDYALFIVLSVFCLKYITYYGKFFAESFIKFPFLDFPIFVGEFLLAFCLILFITRTILVREKFQTWYWALIVFYAFVVIKAIVGYLQFGPLALRDAALFYYSLFAMIGYFCYREEAFKGWLAFCLYLGLFWLAFDSKYNEFWLVPRIFLGLALALKAPNRYLGSLMAIGVLAFTPYQYFLNTSRSVFLGGFVAISFMLIVVLFLLKPRFRNLFIVCNLFLIVCFGAYMFHFSGSKPAQGLLAIDKLKIFFQEMTQEIERKKSGFIPIEVNNVKIFRPNEKIENTDGTKHEKIIEEPVLAQQTEIPKDGVQEEINGPAVDKPDVSSANDTRDSIHQMKLGNSVFRLLLWQDAVEEMFREKKIMGINFGKPFRSENLEIIRSAVNEWKRDGWIAMHNSYLNILYRAGLVGLLYIVVIFLGYVFMVRTFIVHQSLAGLLASASLLVPFVIAFFAVTFELPYTAIPIWTLYGLVLGAARDKWSKSNPI